MRCTGRSGEALWHWQASLVICENRKYIQTLFELRHFLIVYLIFCFVLLLIMDIGTPLSTRACHFDDEIHFLM